MVQEVVVMVIFFPEQSSFAHLPTRQKKYRTSLSLSFLSNTRNPLESQIDLVNLFFCLAEKRMGSCDRAGCALLTTIAVHLAMRSGMVNEFTMANFSLGWYRFVE
jgi:hypothetical protein